jgi:hypothetical protein
MKKNIFTAVCILTCSASQAGNTLSNYQKIEACDALDSYQVAQDTGREDILDGMVKFNVLKGSDVTYTLVGTPKKISAKKQYQCHYEWPDKFTYEECIFGSGSYAFWESEGHYPGYTRKLVRDWEKDGFSNRDARDFLYTPTRRGEKYITGLVTEKDFKVEVRKGVSAPDIPEDMTYEWPQIPFLHNYEWLNNQVIKMVERKLSGAGNNGIKYDYASIPMCDVIKVNAQSAPTISKKSLSLDALNGTPIIASVNYTFDEQFSYAASNNTPLTFTWTFKNISYSGIVQQVTTTSPSINFVPEFTGEYRVTATVNDGTFSATSFLGYSYFDSGSNDCPPIGGGDGCQQPF